METVAMVAVLLLAVYGCMEGIRQLAVWLVCPLRGAWVLCFRGHCEDVEFAVRCAAAKRCGKLAICAVEIDTDEQTHAALETVCSAVQGAELFTPSTFCERFF